MTYKDQNEMIVFYFQLKILYLTILVVYKTNLSQSEAWIARL
jgi:hypothetical protein